MTGTVATQVKAISFDRDIERLTEGFTGREWVFEEIDRWLQQGNERFFILTGEPGVGKSAIAAQLTQTRKDIAAYHFCIARQISTVEPNNVLLSLAAQLIKYFPDYGEALVNTVKPLFLQVKVEINIENIRDSVVQGVVIENLHIHYPKQALDIVLRQALAALPNPPKKPVLILIDSLDEAVTYSNENNLVTLLSSVDDLPSWVRFILTSRPDKQRVLSYFETLDPYHYHLNELSEKNKKDIHDYVDGRVVSELIQVQIQRFQIQPEALINQITKLSQGNFLYTKVLLDDIELGGQPLDNLAALPKSLNELYHNFLLRLKAEWEGKYQPIFGILTVTKAPVTEEELTNLLSKQLDETELGQRLRVVQQFLDVVQNDYAENTYTLFHQSLQDYLTDKEKSGVFHCSPKDGHRQIIEYCWQYHPRDWRECDLYGLRYLATHLVDIAALEKPPIKARKYIERLHELLATEVDGRNAWFDAKDRIGETAGFLADIELAWTQADEAYEHEPERRIGLQCRYALIKTSINTLSEIPTALMVGLVKYQYWKPSKALAYACQMPSPKERFSSLLALAEQVPISEPLRSQVLRFALKSIAAMKHDAHRSEAMAVLVDKLTSDLLPQALDIALAIQDENHRVQALAALADRLPAVIPQALDIALAIQYEFYQIEALTALASKLTPDLLPKALETTLSIYADFGRAQVLTALADKLTPDLLPKALDAVLAIDTRYRAQALTTLVDKLTPDLLSQALDAALSMKYDFDRAQILTALAGKLPELLAQALDTTLAIQNITFFSVPTLTALSSKLTPDLLPQALDAALAFHDESSRAQILTSLAAQLTPELLCKALDAALTIHNEEHLAEVLTALADKLTPELLPKALDAALTIQDEYERAKTVTALARKLPEAVPKALEVVFIIHDDWRRAKVLASLADKLTPDLLHKALDAALAIQKKPPCIYALTALADELPEVLPKALEVALTIQDEYERGQALTALADKLPEVLPKALEVALTIHDEYERGQALTALADKLPEVLPKALEVALTIQDEYKRGQALTALADKLPEVLPKALDVALTLAFRTEGLGQPLITLADKLTPDLLPRTLDAASAFKDEEYRAEVLIALTNKLTPDLLSKTLDAASAFRSETYRAKVLIALAEKLTPNLLPKALDIATAIQDVTSRANALTALVHKSPKALPEALDTALSIQDASSRANALAALADELPEVLPKALEVALTIQDECKRAKALTALADKLPEALPKALDAALDIIHKLPELQAYSSPAAVALSYEAYTEALDALGDKLTPDLLYKALDSVIAIRDDSYRTQAFMVLADKFTPDLLPKALDVVRTIRDEKSLTRVLTYLSPNLVNASNRFNIWKDALHFLSYQTRPNLLRNIAVLMPVLAAFGDDASEETAQAIQDVSRWWP